MALVENGKLTIPLFHGTSSLFAESIAKNGLGAKNPIDDLHVLTFLKKLICLADTLLAEDEMWLAWNSVTKRMLNQGRHFQHGSCYLSPSRETAIRYAISNPFGSEIISVSKELYDQIHNLHPQYALNTILEGLPLMKILEETPFPVLAEVSEVDVSSLMGETGENPEEIINEISNITALQGDEVVFDAVIQQSNFRLIRSLEPGKAKLYKIKIARNGPGYGPEYEFEPIVC